MNGKVLYWYSGPWRWVADDALSCWSPPDGCGGLDLRSLSQQSQQGGAPGLGIFCGDVVPAAVGSEFDLLGSGNWHDVKATKRLIDALPARPGYRPKGNDLVGLLRDLLLDGADPDGLDFAKPLVPGVDGLLSLHCGQSHYERFRWGDPHTAKLQGMLRKEFRGLMDDADNGKLKDSHHHLRVLDAWCEKYGVDDWKEFVEPSLHKDVPGRVRHDTTITDNFNRADSGTLGASSEGWSWSEVAGNIDIVSNRAQCNATGSRARAATDLSSADHYAQALLVGLGTTGKGPAVRYTSADTMYAYLSDGGRLFKITAGTLTSLASSSTPANDSTCKVQISGSSLSGWINGSNTVNATDTAITGILRTGIWLHNSGSIVDDFTAADIAAGGGMLYTQLESTPRGVNRGAWTRGVS